MIRNPRFILPALLSGLMTGMAGAAPILLVDPFSGKLVGAQDVSIEGNNYDVTFVFNTCDALFAACAGPNEGDPAYDPAADRAPFPGPLSGGGDPAATALRDQVFLDGAAPGAAKFDTDPSLTSCPPGKPVGDCYVHSPAFWAPKEFGTSVFSAVFANGVAEADDFIFTEHRREDDPLLYAVWNTAPRQAVLQVDSLTGRLIGARNIPVAGDLYDVRFLFGSCNDLFAYCAAYPDKSQNDDGSLPPRPSGPGFPTPGGPTEAMEALRDYVFVDGTSPGAARFDSDPSLGPVKVYSPWGEPQPRGTPFDVFNAYFVNGPIDQDDELFWPEHFDQTRRVTYAVWSPAAVPEPDVEACLVIAAALGLVTRRRRPV
jgi:hypothetical protein